MGALHEGHGALIRCAQKENDICIVSIFVNPAQFGPKEDFKRYPRTLEKDKGFLKRMKVDVLFLPSAKEMYPQGFESTVETGQLGRVLCGRSRPGHFNAVATVVIKLLNIVEPRTMVLGQKDAQQVIILKRIVADFDFKTRIRICPTERNTLGLALSSRNRYLNGRERLEALVLYRSLKEASARIKGKERSAQKITDGIRALIQRHTHGTIDYIACVDAATLQPLTMIKGRVMLALAVRFGKARLIDNMIVNAA